MMWGVRFYRLRLHFMMAWILGALLSFQPAFANDLGFLPKWNPGDHWQVNTRYIHLSSVHKKKASENLDETFAYLIMPCHEDKTCIELSIRRVPDDLYSLRLTLAENRYNIHAITESRGRGKKRYFQENSLGFSSQQPFVSRFILAPVDFPHFPVTPGTVQTFETVRDLEGGLKVRRTIIQRVAESVGIPEKPQLMADQSLIRVECLDEKGELLFLQYWHQDFPWAIFGVNQNCEYQLVLEDVNG